MNRGSSTYQYIAQSREEVFHKMADYWYSEEGEKALVGSTEEAVEKMRNEKLVMFLNFRKKRKSFA